MIVNKNNYDIKPFLDTHEVKGRREEHLDYVLSRYVEQGDYFLEFGVWQGNTINRTADKFPNQLFIKIIFFNWFRGYGVKLF